MAIMFYRSTRPQAPKHSKCESLVQLIECSECRGLYLGDTKEARASHKAWHEAHTEPVDAGNRVTYGNGIEGRFFGRQDCREVEALGGQYWFLRICDECGEDLCPCDRCTAVHATECALWLKVAALVDEDRGEDADTLADAIVATRL